jgi:HNH endonuclease
MIDSTASANTETCIWCQHSDDFTLEHILPDALGCPTHLTLGTSVCRECNRTNGKLDRALLKPFEFITVIKGIPRKKGRRPTIDGHSTFASGYDENGPALFFNRERFPVDTPLGKRLERTSSVDVIERFDVKDIGNGTAEIKIKQRLVFDRSAVRGLFKIALELIAFHEGTAAVQSPLFDHVRRYVRYDEGELFALLIPGGPLHHYMPNRFSDGTGGIVVPMTIHEIGFICDFSPDFRNGKNLAAAGMLMNTSSTKIPM